MQDNVCIVIPARYASERYPGKPLAPLAGVQGTIKPLIQRTWEAAQRVPSISRVIITSDSEEILKAAEGFGAEAIMTSAACRNGSERCAELVAKLANAPDVVINFQGDAPLIPPHFVEGLLGALADDRAVRVATPVVRCDRHLYQKLAADETLGIVGGTFAVVSEAQDAHYFSKKIIPHFNCQKFDTDDLPVLLHVGLYAYRASALREYAAAPPSRLELLEGLEQLRFLELGIPIRTVEVMSPEWEIWELNNPSDIPHIESSLAVMCAE